MTRKISSRWTSFYKIGVPCLYLISTATQGCALALRIPDLEKQVAFLVCICVCYFTGLLFILWFGRFYKHVTLSPEGLAVTGYFVSDVVPFSCIADIKQSIWMAGRPVCVLLDGHNRFGGKIAFQPRGTRPMRGEHPIVAELRQLARHEDGSSLHATPPPLPATKPFSLKGILASLGVVVILGMHIADRFREHAFDDRVAALDPERVTQIDVYRGQRYVGKSLDDYEKKEIRGPAELRSFVEQLKVADEYDPSHPEYYEHYVVLVLIEGEDRMEFGFCLSENPQYVYIRCIKGFSAFGGLRSVPLREWLDRNVRGARTDGD